MFGKKKKSDFLPALERFSSLISANMKVVGNIEFVEGLKVEGLVCGNVTFKSGTESLLALSEEGCIEGSVSSYDALIDGMVVGDLRVERLLELHSKARVKGNIYYRQLCVEGGAVVEGQLYCLGEALLGDEET